MLSLGSLLASKGGVQVYISLYPLRSILCLTVVVREPMWVYEMRYLIVCCRLSSIMLSGLGV